MNAPPLLSKVKVASPCSARWDDMTGDEKSRFCGQCKKQVYNLSAMSAEEATELIRAKEGRLCGRFYRRRDGTMLSANCPIGVARCVLRLKVLAATAAAMLLTSLGLRGWSNGNATGEKGAFAQKCENVLWTVKGWLGLNPKMPTVTMGVICIPTPPPAAPPPSAAPGPNPPDGEKP